MKPLVVLSGGQDSTTCLFLAVQQAGAENVRAVTFYYGQRHSRELEAARIVAEMAGVEHEVLDLPNGVLAGKSPLVDPDVDVEHYDKPEDMPSGIEPTFVPGRNILFLSLAANRAHVHGCDTIMIGVGQEDYGGYPDCRQEFIGAMERAISLGVTGELNKLHIEAPLMNLSKRQTVNLAKQLPGCLAALAYSHTCYDGKYPPNPKNHASILRAKGFMEAGIPDPLIIRAKNEGVLPSNYPDHGFTAAAKVKASAGMSMGTAAKMPQLKIQIEGRVTNPGEEETS